VEELGSDPLSGGSLPSRSHTANRPFSPSSLPHSCAEFMQHELKTTVLATLQVFPIFQLIHRLLENKGNLKLLCCVQ
jgi:hypothetical protein